MASSPNEFTGKKTSIHSSVSRTIQNDVCLIQMHCGPLMTYAPLPQPQHDANMIVMCQLLTHLSVLLVLSTYIIIGIGLLLFCIIFQSYICYKVTQSFSLASSAESSQSMINAKSIVKSLFGYLMKLIFFYMEHLYNYV